MIGCAMMLGNFVAMRCIKNVNRKLYRNIVAGVMIALLCVGIAEALDFVLPATGEVRDFHRG